MAVAFNNVGAISGLVNGANILSNPTSVQFGPDGRLYVTEQNGTINAFTVEVQLGRYVATAVEEIDLVKNIQNHNDDGSLYSPASQTRQVTGLLATGTAANPVLYVTSSDPRIATNQDKNLDTNSGVLTKLTWNGSAWQAVDLIRGLPRSEENHSPNGMVLSPDGQKLYLMVGGNTNNGAPSSFFANTAEYALSASLLEIDLAALAALAVKTDTSPGLNNGRKYVYDLPTLDDPNTPNDGVREKTNGMDAAGPWGGRDGLNQAILPAGAPLSIYATGFRNAYDLVVTADGRLYTVDNGSNENLGGDPIIAGGEATNQINNGGTGAGEPLFLIEKGGYYGHPNPTRSNQDQSWTVYDDAGNPDASLAVNQVADISALVPAGLNIADGYLIAPTKFTADAARLLEEGQRIVHPSAESEALVVIGSSSNGLVEYTADNFDGELQGDLLVAQFNGNVARLNLGPDGTTATYETIPGLSGLSTPLDVALGPDGTLWVAEIAGGKISVFAPSDVIVPGNPDTDDDGIANSIDPFLRDATNGGQAFILPNKTVLWDFDANQDGNRPGPGGYGGGLTGVMIDGTTDFDAFFNEPADFPQQNIKLDNVKFTTAAGGGTTVIENVATGDATATVNSGEYLFHTGATVANTVDQFTVKLTTINPFGELGANSGPFQQIGSYVGTGDQSNFLKLVAIRKAAGGKIEFGLENGDVYTKSTLNAPGLIDVPLDQEIVFEVLIDRVARTAKPKVTYELGDGTSQTVTGAAISIAGSNVEKAIDGQWAVQGQTTGLALGLYASNVGQTDANTFQAIFTDLEVIGEGATDGTVLHRVNAGGPAVAATDGGPAWTVNSATDLGPYMTDPGGNKTSSSALNARDATLPAHVPTAIIQTMRYDNPAAPSMKYAFQAPEAGIYEVRLFLGNYFAISQNVGDTIFDVKVEGVIDSAFNNIDPVALFGHREVGMVSAVFEVRDGALDLEFLHDVDGNPLVNGIEILHLASFNQPLATLSIQPPSPQTVQELGNDGETLLIFPVVFDHTPVSPVTVSYEVSINGVVTVANGTLDLGFDDGFVAVPVPNDGIDNGPETVQVTLTGITAGDNGTDLGQVSATGSVTEDDAAAGGTPLFRVNVGGPQLAAADGSSLGWAADTAAAPSPYLTSVSSLSHIYKASSSTAYGPIDASHPSIPPAAPEALFATERYDSSSAPNMVWNFPVAAGTYIVNLYFAELYSGIDAAGERVEDVAVEGTVPAIFDDIDAFATGGPAGGFMRSHTVAVSDGALTLEFLRGLQNPDISAIEIIATAPPPPGNPGAFVQVTPNAANIDRSVYNDNSFIIENTGGLDITSISFDLGTSLLPDLVFDPNGKAGDPAARGVRVSSTSDAVGFVVPGNLDLDPFSDFHNGVDDEEGYDVVTLDFTDFDPGERFLFGADVDPTSIKGVGFQTKVGSVSGLELIGSKVTITFADGTSLTRRLFEDGSNGGAEVTVLKGLPATPKLSLVGLATPGSTGEAEQILRVEGKAGQKVTILQVDGRLGLPEPDFTPYDLDPFEANMAMARKTYSATIGTGGFVDVPVTLLRTAAADTFGDGGLNHFVAAAHGGSGKLSNTSKVLVVEFEPAAQAAELQTLTVRAGGKGTAETAPAFELFADGVSLGMRTITDPHPFDTFNAKDDGLYQDYVFEFTGPAPDEVEIVYLNDGTSDGVHRNLVVDYVELGGRRFESEEAGYFTPDNGNPLAFGPREKLPNNGVLAFTGLADELLL